MQAARKEVCGEANWNTRIKGAEEHAKTTVVIWSVYTTSPPQRAGVREGREGRGGTIRLVKRKRIAETEGRRRGKRGDGCGRKNTDVKGSTVWYNLPLSIFSIIHYSFT